LVSVLPSFPLLLLSSIELLVKTMKKKTGEFLFRSELCERQNKNAKINYELRITNYENQRLLCAQTTSASAKILGNEKRDRINYELRITNYELRITNYELRITNYENQRLLCAQIISASAKILGNEKQNKINYELRKPTAAMCTNNKCVSSKLITNYEL
jgi:hypothetical protein